MLRYLLKNEQKKKFTFLSLGAFIFFLFACIEVIEKYFTNTVKEAVKENHSTYWDAM